MLGMHGTAFANYAVDDCDFLIALGARFDDRVAGAPDRVCPQRETDRALRRRCLGDRQGQARAVAPRRPAVRGAGRAASARPARTGFRPNWAGWHRHLDGLKTHTRDELRPREPAHPAALRDRRDQPPNARRGDHHDRRRPAPDVGRAVLRFPRAAAVAHVRQHGDDGVRTAGRDRRAVRAVATGW